MRWKLDDLAVFRAIVEAGSLTRAARALEMPKSTVSHVLHRLEADLGLRLIERNARSIGITPEGQTLHHYACRILEEAHEADVHLGGLRSKPSGRVSLAVPAAFCREYLAPNLPKFVAMYPDIALDIVIASREVDVLGGEFDLAVVVGDQVDSSLSQKRLLAGGLLWIASPEYLESHHPQKSVGDLAKHLLICEARYAGKTIDVHIEGKASRLNFPERVSRINDPLCVREAVMAGMGVSFLPARYCSDQILSGKLVSIWDEVKIDTDASKLSLIFPGRRLMAPRCSAVIGFLEEICT